MTGLLLTFEILTSLDRTPAGIPCQEGVRKGKNSVPSRIRVAGWIDRVANQKGIAESCLLGETLPSNALTKGIPHFEVSALVWLLSTSDF